MAVRRAAAARRRFVWRLTAEDWTRDELHRQECPSGLDCDRTAHWYRLALPEGRVLVDGMPVVEEGGRWVPQASSAG